jgi:hypothetical protein
VVLLFGFVLLCSVPSCLGPLYPGGTYDMM